MATGWEIAKETPIAASKPDDGGWNVKSETPAEQPGLLDRISSTEIPGVRVTPGQIGHTLIGEMGAVTNPIMNIPSAAYGGVADLVRRLRGESEIAPGDKKIVDALHVNGSPDTAAIADTLSGTPAAQKVGELGRQADRAVENFSPTLLDTVRQVNGVAGDVTNILPAAAGATAAAGKVGSVLDAATAARTAEEATPAGQAGMRSGAGHPIAQPTAGESGRVALTQHNQTLGNQIAANEAGHVPVAPMSAESLAAARTEPSAVYNRLARALGPNNQLDAQAVQAVHGAGAPEGGRITAGTPQAQQQIAELQAKLTDPHGNFSGDQLVNEMRGLRQEGYAGVGSEDVSAQEVGKAKLDMANAIEEHIGRNLPANADVSMEQFQQARQALAKNHAVETALRGNNVDLQAIARMSRADPGLMTGGLKALGDFANQNPTVTGLASRTYEKPSFLSDVLGSGGKNPETLLDPGKIVGIFGGRAGARRALTGSTGNALESANRMFPRRDPTSFGPIERPPTPPNPDVVDFTRPEGPGPLTATAPASAGAAPAPGGFSLADLLSHGVEQPAPTGLSLADELGAGGPRGQGIPFHQNVEHVAGPTALAPENAWFHEPPQALGDQFGTHADVMSQGVPEGIVSRTQRPVKGTVQGVDFPSGVESPARANNASGESSASQEAVNRVADENSKGLSRFVVDPDGNVTPLKGVDSADAKAPKGSIIIQTGGGAEPTILDRGNLPSVHARGLMKRALSRRDEPDLAEALGAGAGG